MCPLANGTGPLKMVPMKTTKVYIGLENTGGIKYEASRDYNAF